MKTFNVLVEDHKKLRKSMKHIEGLYKKSPNHIEPINKEFQKFKILFSRHDKIEEDVLYKRLLEISQLKELTLKAQQAHHAAKSILTELRLLSFAHEAWLPKFLILQDSILVHMQEEEDILFIKAEAMISPTELENLEKALNDYNKKRD